MDQGLADTLAELQLKIGELERALRTITEPASAEAVTTEPDLHRGRIIDEALEAPQTVGARAGALAHSDATAPPPPREPAIAPDQPSAPQELLQIDARLRAQVLDCGVYIVRPAAPVLTALSVSEFLQARTAFPKAAQIQRERMDPCCGKLRCYRVPRFAIAIDLVKQQHTGAGLGRGKVSCLQRRAVGSLKIDDAWSSVLRESNATSD